MLAPFQFVAVMAALVYSGGMSFVLLKAINLVVPIRAEKTDEIEGLDVTQHGEEVPCDQWEPIDEWRLVSRMPRYTASDAAMTAVR
jgi:hypothetical protein